MQKPIIIFGTGEIAELAAYLFEYDGQRDVAAFTADNEFVESTSIFEKPLISADALLAGYPPNMYDMFIAIGYSENNKLRTAKFIWAKEQGYDLCSYVSPRSTIFDNFVCGINCFILENNTIQPFVTIGNNVTLWSGNHIGHHSSIADNVFVASHVVISGQVRIGAGTFIGVNATIGDHISVGEDCVVGAGALVLKDAGPGTVFRGTASVRQDSSEACKRG